jgi:hypothetical protein
MEVVDRGGRGMRRMGPLARGQVSPTPAPDGHLFPNVVVLASGFSGDVTNSGAADSIASGMLGRPPRLETSKLETGGRLCGRGQRGKNGSWRLFHLHHQVRLQFLPIIATTTLVFGCSLDPAQDDLSESPTGRVFGGPSEDPLFTPYQGEWRLEFREFDPVQEDVAISGGPDISINGHIIRFGSGMLVSELRLCQTRKTAGGIECEAWHHEDIHDPGDMQRADCKLRMNGESLELHWRIMSSGEFSDDPIIASSDYVPPDRSDDAESSIWWIETYSRKVAK